MGRDSIHQVMSFMGARKIKYYIFILIKAITISVCSNIVIAFVGKNVFDGITKGVIQYIYKSIAIVGITFAVGLLIELVSQYMLKNCVSKTIEDIKKRISKCIKNKYYKEDLISIVDNDIKIINNFYLDQMFNLIFALVQCIVSLILIFFLEWRIGCIVLIVDILTIFVNRKFNVKLIEENNIVQEQMSELGINITQYNKTEELFNMKDIHNVYMEKIEEMSKNIIKRDRVEIQFLAINNFFYIFNCLGIFLIGIYLFIKGITDISTVIAIIFIQGNVNYSCRNMSNFIIDMQNSLLSVEKIMGIMDLPMEDERSSLSR